MASAPLLAMLFRFSGTPQVVRLLNGYVPTAVGGSLPGASLETDSQGIQKNRVVQFRDRLFAVQGSWIWEFNPLTNTWATNQFLTNTTATTTPHWGIHVVKDANGDSMLFTAWEGTSGGHFWAAKSLTGNPGSWTITLLAGESPSNIQYRPHIVFRNQVFCIFTSLSPWRIRVIDPPSFGLTNINGPGPGNAGHAIAFGIFKNNLYMLVINGSTFAIELYRYEIGTFLLVQNLTVLQVATVGQAGFCTPALFTDGTSLFALFPAQNGGGLKSWHLTQLTPNGSIFTETDRNANLPSDWKDDGPRAGDKSQTHVLIDNETDPLVPTIHIYQSSLNTAAGGGSYYQWPGVGVNWPVAIASVPPHYAICAPAVGGGDCYWSLADLGIRQSANPVGVTNGQSLSFIASGDAVTLLHGGITGTLVIGDTVTGATSGATGTIVGISSNTIEIGGVASGPFQNGEDIYKTISVNYVTASSAPTGGGADKTVRIYISGDEGTPATLAILQGTATGGTAVRVGNTVTQVIADGITEYTVEVNLVAMGISAGNFVHWQYEVTP